jgi:hypothetical protein
MLQFLNLSLTKRPCPNAVRINLGTKSLFKSDDIGIIEFLVSQLILVLLLVNLEILVNVTNEDVVLINVDKPGHVLNNVWLRLGAWLVNCELLIGNVRMLLWLIVWIEFNCIDDDFKILFCFLNRNQFASILANATDQSLLVVNFLY